MSAVLNLIKLVISLIPILTTAILAVEEAIPGKGAGEAKLAAVRAILENAFRLGTDVTVTFETVWGTLQPTIAALVAAFNATGWRKPKPAEPAA